MTSPRKIITDEKALHRIIRLAVMRVPAHQVATEVIRELTACIDAPEVEVTEADLEHGRRVMTRAARPKR